MSQLPPYVFNSTVLLSAIVLALMLMKYPRERLLMSLLMLAGCGIYVLLISQNVLQARCTIASGFWDGLRSLDSCVDDDSGKAWIAQVAILSGLFGWVAGLITRSRGEGPRDRSQR